MALPPRRQLRAVNTHTTTPALARRRNQVNADGKLRGGRKACLGSAWLVLAAIGRWRRPVCGQAALAAASTDAHCCCATTRQLCEGQGGRRGTQDSTIEARKCSMCRPVATSAGNSASSGTAVLSQAASNRVARELQLGHANGAPGVPRAQVMRFRAAIWLEIAVGRAGARRRGVSTCTACCAGGSHRAHSRGCCAQRHAYTCMQSAPKRRP